MSDARDFDLSASAQQALNDECARLGNRVGEHLRTIVTATLRGGGLCRLDDGQQRFLAGFIAQHELELLRSSEAPRWDVLTDAPDPHDVIDPDELSGRDDPGDTGPPPVRPVWATYRACGLLIKPTREYSPYRHDYLCPNYFVDDSLVGDFMWLRYAPDARDAIGGPRARPGKSQPVSSLLRPLVIMCGGDQASWRRHDRELQAHGYSVARFSGPELQRDALACAREAERLFGAPTYSLATPVKPY